MIRVQTRPNNSNWLCVPSRLEDEQQQQLIELTPSQIRNVYQLPTQIIPSSTWELLFAWGSDRMLMWCIFSGTSLSYTQPVSPEWDISASHAVTPEEFIFHSGLTIRIHYCSENTPGALGVPHSYPCLDVISCLFGLCLRVDEALRFQLRVSKSLPAVFEWGELMFPPGRLSAARRIRWSQDRWSVVGAGWATTTELRDPCCHDNVGVSQGNMRS